MGILVIALSGGWLVAWNFFLDRWWSMEVRTIKDSIAMVALVLSWVVLAYLLTLLE